MSSASNRILMVLTSNAQQGENGEPTGAYLPEVSHPYEIFTKAGYAVDFVSPQGGRPPFYGVDKPDATSRAFLDDKAIQAQLDTTLRPEDIDPASYAAIFYAGGHGTMWDFPDHEHLASIASQIDAKGGVVSAVCHGPAGLINVKRADGSYLVADRDVAAFTNEEETAAGLDKVVPFLLADALTQRGARHQPAGKWQPKVVVSDRLVTGQNPASARGVAEAVVATLQQPAT